MLRAWASLSRGIVGAACYATAACITAGVLLWLGGGDDKPGPSA